MTNPTISLTQFFRLSRLNKPIGIFLLLWPTVIALWIAGNGHPDPKIVFIFVMGVIVMRSAGCVINDLADQSFDGKVERTKTRPLVTGLVSAKQAFILLSLLLLIAFSLVLQLNVFTLKLSFIALFLATLYPFMKRYTHFPQVILGAAFGFAIPMAFAAQLNTIPSLAWLLYLATVFWVIAFDTQYAMVDRKDDIMIGVKSTAIFCGNYDRWAIPIMQIIALILFAGVGFAAGLTHYFYLAILIALGFVFYQWRLIFKREPEQCFRAFLNNNALGACLFLGVLLDYY